MSDPKGGRPTPDSGPSEADLRLLERLGAIAEVVDPVPDHVRELSRALFSLRDPDAELMLAVEVEADRLEAVRGTSPTSRMHFFEFGELSVDVELTVSGGFCDVVGVVADPAGSVSGSVTLDTTAAACSSCGTSPRGCAVCRWSVVLGRRCPRPGSRPADAQAPHAVKAAAVARSSGA